MRPEVLPDSLVSWCLCSFQIIGTFQVFAAAQLHRFGVPMIDLDEEELASDLRNA